MTGYQKAQARRLANWAKYPWTPNNAFASTAMNRRTMRERIRAARRAQDPALPYMLRDLREMNRHKCKS